MANISSAHGHLIMTEAFFCKYKNVLIDAFGIDGEYGIWPDFSRPVISDGQAIVYFEGAGKWSMDATFPYEWVWAEYRPLKDILLREQPTFRLRFVDYEPNIGIFRTEKAEVSFAVKNVQMQSLEAIYTVIGSEPIALTDRNRIMYGFEEGYTSEEIAEDAHLAYYEAVKPVLDIFAPDYRADKKTACALFAEYVDGQELLAGGVTYSTINFPDEAFEDLPKFLETR